MNPRISRFIDEHRPPTPCLVLDLDVVAERYEELRTALPDAAVYYAVKANPEPAVLRRLVGLGASFDVASPGEVDMALAAGAPPARISYGNTIKKQRDIAYAYARGVRLFAFDSVDELEKLAVAAPGASVFCRILAAGEGADWPLSRKFGCEPAMAADLLRTAATLGLDPCGVSFHVGSQQRDPGQWDRPLAEAAALFVSLAASGVRLRLVNLGGGFPAHYLAAVPEIGRYGDAIDESVGRHFGTNRPSLIVEPGRYLAGDAGVLCSEVVLVSRKAHGEERRWVFLDAGVFGGLAETLGESIKYRIRTSVDGGATGPVVIAGPTCDSMDVLYQAHEYHLPEALRPGDRVMFLSAGAYTRSYCSVGFNGFEPLPVFCA
ncbi:MAG: type III PLP-dependent enzyme [Acidimicrobiales bacterium]